MSASGRLRVGYRVGTAQLSLCLKLKSTTYLIVTPPPPNLLNSVWLVFKNYIIIFIKYFPISVRIGPQMWKISRQFHKHVSDCENKSYCLLLISIYILDFIPIHRHLLVFINSLTKPSCYRGNESRFQRPL